MSLNGGYYDVIIGINSLESLGQITLKKCDSYSKDLVIPQKGCDIYYEDSGYENYAKNKDKLVLVIGILGNESGGKTFILQKISGKYLSKEFYGETKGISVKYPEDPKENLVFLDSAGFDSPLLLRKDLSKARKEDKLEAIRKMANDKLITESFICDFILHYSDVSIVVLKAMTEEEQTLMNRIRHKCISGKKKLIVVHNLSKFVEVRQVKDYISRVLLNSFVSELKMREMFPNKDKNNLENKNNVYFIEINKDNEECEINHVILANDNCLAGKYYNEATIRYIGEIIKKDVRRKKFDVIKEFQKYLKESSEKYMDTSLVEGPVIEKERKIRIKDPNSEIKLKEYNVDENGKEYLKDKLYKPNYCYFKNKDENGCWLVIILEITEKIKDIKSEIERETDKDEKYWRFKITGKKERMEVIERRVEESNLYYGPFRLDFRIKMKEYKLKSLKIKKILRDFGYLGLYYEIEM